MFFEKEITLAKGGSDATALFTDLKLSQGVIHYVGVHFPGGCRSLVKVRLILNGAQAFPSVRDQSIAGNNETVQFNEYYNLYKGANSLKVEAWNEDSLNDHTVRVRLGVLQEWQLNPMKQLAEVLRPFRSFADRFQPPKTGSA